MTIQETNSKSYSGICVGIACVGITFTWAILGHRFGLRLLLLLLLLCCTCAQPHWNMPHTSLPPSQHCMHPSCVAHTPSFFLCSSLLLSDDELDVGVRVIPNPILNEMRAPLADGINRNETFFFFLIIFYCLLLSLPAFLLPFESPSSLPSLFSRALLCSASVLPVLFCSHWSRMPMND